jgi:hypothetical protein
MDDEIIGELLVYGVIDAHHCSSPSEHALDGG